MSGAFYHSAEIRWFLPDKGQWDQLLNWFRLQNQLPLNEQGQYEPKTITEAFVKMEKERTDEYLLLPDCDSVSVKQRQGKLEVKALVMGPRPFSLDGVIGRMDEWTKWSFEPSDGRKQSLEIELDQSGPWRKVIKSRFLQKYSFDSGSLVAISPDQRPDTGCNVELTVVEVKSNINTWFTFGFESFGPSGRVMAILDESVRYFFTAHGPSPDQLEGRDSLSYPGWLTMLR